MMTFEEAKAKCDSMNRLHARNDRTGDYTAFKSAKAIQGMVSDAGFKFTHNKRGVFTVHKPEGKDT